MSEAPQPISGSAPQTGGPDPGSTQVSGSNSLSGVPIEDYIGNQVSNPSLPEGTVVSGVMMSAADNEFQQYSGLGSTSPTVGVNNLTAATAASPSKTNANTYGATQIGAGNAAQTAGVSGTLSEKAHVDAQLGGLSADTLASLDPSQVQGQVDPRSLVQYQYAKILSDTGPDGIPLFARDAVRKAQAMMASRGLGASSLAGEAITSAVLQAAMPVAQQDAKVFETMTLANLDKKAQATFLKAGYLAQMDMKNLDNRQQAAVFNAQGFLNLDMKNLDNGQQATLLSTQNRQQTLLSDQAAANAAKQFNAASQNDVDKFFAGLTADIDKFNASQVNAMGQFNTSQEMAEQQFNAQMQNQREQFNVNNKTLIDQSNTQWRRSINTANTTTANATNQINAANLLNQSEFAVQALWQETRDNASWAFQASENQKTREQQVALAAMNRQAIFDQMSEQDKQGWYQALGRFAANMFSKKD